MTDDGLWLSRKQRRTFHQPKSNDLHRALNIEPDRLSEVFCLRDQRHVTKDLMLKYDRKRIKLEINELTRGLVDKFVDINEYGCGRIQVRANGVALPHTIMNPDRLAHMRRSQKTSASVEYWITSKPSRTKFRQR